MSDIVVSGSNQLSTLRVLLATYANSNPSQLELNNYSVRVSDTADRAAISGVLRAEINKWQEKNKIDVGQQTRGLTFLDTGLPADLSVKSIETANTSKASLFSWTESGVARKALVVVGPDYRTGDILQTADSAVSTIFANITQFDPTGIAKARIDGDIEYIKQAFNDQLSTGSENSVDVIGYGSIGDRFATAIGSDFGGPGSKMFRDVVTFDGEKVSGANSRVFQA